MRCTIMEVLLISNMPAFHNVTIDNWYWYYSPQPTYGPYLGFQLLSWTVKSNSSLAFGFWNLKNINIFTLASLLWHTNESLGHNHHLFVAKAALFISVSYIGRMVNVWNFVLKLISVDTTILGIPKNTIKPTYHHEAGC